MDKKVIIVAGSGGLVGGEACRYYLERDYKVIGIDNNMRKQFFGEDGSTETEHKHGKEYHHINADITDFESMEQIFKQCGEKLFAVIHTAAQPSHDLAASFPLVDYKINSTGTINLLEACRLHCPKASFIFTSTNKVYGDKPNEIELYEATTRFGTFNTRYFNGIDEGMSIDQSTHSLYGASKVSADIMVQEYGRYFKMNTAVFRGGCLTGPKHKGVELHGFLSYLIKCTMHNKPYTIYGHGGKQVRDIIHCSDLIKAFDLYIQNPSRPGAVYNIGGGSESNCSILEAISMIEQISGKKLNYTISDTPRVGDHKWWISDISRFRSDYPTFALKHGIRDIIKEMVDYEATILVSA
jgi:CDP-paratose 2-epimerase